MISSKMKDNHIFMILSCAALIFLFNCVWAYADPKGYNVYSARHIYYTEYFSELDEDSKVRCLLTIPWRPDPEAVENIIFLSAGQQAIGSSTDSNVTGGHKGQQELFYDTERNSLNSLVQVLINNNKFDWFVNGTTQGEKDTIKLAVGGAMGGAIGLVFGSIGGAIFGGITGGLIGLGTLPNVEFKLDKNREYIMSFFHKKSLAENLMALDNLIMPDGTILNQENTLIFLNIRGLCVKESEDTRKKNIKAYCNMLKDLSADFINTRLIYLAGHSRGAVQTLRMGEYFRENNLVNPKRTRILVTSIDAVADPGEVHSNSDNWVLNPYEMNNTSSNGSIPAHHSTYYGYFSNLQDYLGTSIPANNLEQVNYDGSFYINNLVSGSLLMENYYKKLEKAGLGELTEKLTGKLTDQYDKSAICMDYDMAYVQNSRRYNLLGCYSQNWIFEDHPDLCTDYIKARIKDQYEFFKTMGFFPSYNIETEVKVSKDTASKPVISWNMVDEKIWNKVRPDQIITYNVYRKITKSVLKEPLYVRDGWTLVKSGLTASPYTDDLKDENFPEEIDLSTDDNIYYKIACVVTTEGIYDPVNPEEPEANSSVEPGEAISNSYWTAIGDRQKYEYTSESTGASAPYTYKGMNQLEYDEYYYSAPVPRSKKSVYIPQFEYQIPEEIDEELYTALSEHIKEHYIYDPGEEQWVLKSELDVLERKAIRDYLHTNKIDYHNYTCIDFFDNAFTYELFTEEHETGSIDSYVYYHEVKTNKKVVEPLKELRADNAILALPVNIYNYANDTEIEFSINGGEYVTGIPLESVSEDDDLIAYAEEQLASGIYGSSFVYNSEGKGLIFSKNYKDGFNTIYFNFNDPYQNNCELIVFQQSLPPFIMPIYPLQDQYINTPNPEIIIGAVYLNQYIVDIVGIDWFEEADINIRLDGNEVYDFSRNNDDRIITFQPEDLSPGNHRLEVKVKIKTTENESGWRFWVDTEAPVVTFPQRMTLSNISKAKTGSLLAYIRDEIPYRGYTGELLTNYNTSYLESLEMKIIDTTENEVMTFLELENCRLGVAGGFWNGWKAVDGISSERLPHGKYYLDVTATDRAGNITPASGSDGKNRAAVIIDTQGPALTGALVNYLIINNQIVINHDLASSIDTPPALEVSVGLDEWEEDTGIIIVYKNIDSNEIIRKKIGRFPEGNHSIILEDVIAGADGIKDGIYDIIICGEDEIGNITEFDLQRIVLDRTAPVIEKAAVLPPTMTGDEDIIISFNAKNTGDAEIFQNDPLTVEISIVDTSNVIFEGAIGNGIDVIEFMQQISPPEGVEPGEGCMKFSVSDSRGNVAHDIVLFIMEYLPPEIQSVEPSLNGIIDGDGNILIKGRVLDPHFNNSNDFIRYGLFYKYFEDGSEPAIPEDLANIGTWESAAMTVPDYQKVTGWPDNYGHLTVPGYGLLGILDGNSVSDGYYKLLLIAEEEGGIRTAGSRIIYIDHDTLDTTQINIEFDSPPANKEFTADDDLLALEYTVTHQYSNPVDLYGYIKHIESGDIIKTYTFNNHISSACKGEPAITAADKGFFLYKESDGRYYLVCKNNAEKAREFKAILDTQGEFQDVVLPAQDGFTPDYFSDNGTNLTLVTVLEPSQSCSINFVLAANMNFDVACLMDSAAGPLYLGNTRQAVDLVYSLNVSETNQDQNSIINGEPVIGSNDKGFFFYKDDTGSYTCIAHNSLEDENTFSIVLTTESEIINIKVNGEDWLNPDPSADKDLLSMFQTLTPGGSYAISFEVSGNQDFNVFCDSGGELGPLYLGKNKIPVALNYKARITGHDETTKMVWYGKDRADRWAADGDYIFVLEAAGRNGGYAKAQAQILITSPLLLHFISITNAEIKPLAEEICQVVMSSEKPCSIDVIAIDEDLKLVKNITTQPIILERANRFSFTWNGTDNENSILPDDPDTLYTFVVTATPTGGGNPVTYTVEQKVTVNSRIILDDSVKAEITFPAPDSVIKGDSSFIVEIEPSGNYYPDVDARVKFKAVEGTQAVVATPYLNYLAGIRCIYTGAFADVTITADMYVNGNKNETYTIINGEYIIADYSINTVTGNGNFNMKAYYLENSRETYLHGYSQEPVVEFRNIKVTINKGTEYANITCWSKPIEVKQFNSTTWIVESTFRTWFLAKDSFDEADYLRIADRFWTAGPDISSENQNIYKHHMDYVHAWSRKTEFTVNVKKESEFESDYLFKEPRFYLYSLTEDYPDLNQEDFKYEQFLSDTAQSGDRISLSAFNSAKVKLLDLRNNLESVTDNDIKFDVSGYAHIFDSDIYVETIFLEVWNNARTKLVCDYPYPKALYDKNELRSNNQLIAKINDGRNDSDSVPSYHINPISYHLDYGYYPNIFFESGDFEMYKPFEFSDSTMKPELTRTGTLSYDLHLNESYAPGYAGEINFNFAGNFSNIWHEDLSIETWEVADVEFTGDIAIIGHENLTGTEFTIDGTEGNTFAIRIPEDASIYPAESPWNLGLDNYYTPQLSIITAPQDILDNNPEGLHKTGKTTAINIAELYEPGPDLSDENPTQPPAFWNRSMLKFLSDNWIDNDSVLIHPHIGGMYDIKVKGIDHRDFGGLCIINDDISYNGKGGKLLDKFNLSLTNESVRRLVPVIGEWDRSPGTLLTLSFPDAFGNWQYILEEGEQPADPENNIIDYWDVTGLNGLIPLKLTVQNGEGINITISNVIIGERINTDSGLAHISSAKGESTLTLSQGSLAEDKILSIDAVELDDIRDIVDFQDIPEVGKIISLQPEGLEFEAGKTASLQFIYHWTEVKDVNLKYFTICKVKPDGTLKELNTIHRYFKNDSEDYIYEYETDDPDSFLLPGSFDYVKVLAILTGFSYYSTIEDQLIGGPHLDQVDELTNQQQITITGKGEPGQLMMVYVLDNPFFNPEDAAPAGIPLVYSDSEGYFEIPNIPLPFEGKNYLFAGYNLGINGKWSKCVVERDTIPPVLTVGPYNPVISPDGDGIRDTLPLYITSNEDGMFDVILKDSDQNTLGLLGTSDVSEDVQTTFLVDGTDGSGHILPDGIYQLQLIPEDIAGNRGTGNIYILIIDNAGTYDGRDIIPPQTDIIIGDPRYLAPDNTLFITSLTPVRLQAVDNIGGSGIHQINYRINQGNWVIINAAEYLFTINGQDGLYTIEYFSFDLWGNPEPVKSISLYLDNSAPQTGISTHIPHYLSPDNQLYITSQTPVHLSAVDVIGGSGVNVIYYRINFEAWVSIDSTGSTFTLQGADGRYVIEYYSKDNCGNRESRKRTNLYLDNTPPRTELTPGYPQFLSPDNKFFITSQTPLQLNADDDDGSGIDVVNYRINGGSWISISEIDYTFMITGEDGMYVIDYYSIDNCGNSESVKSATFYLDNTPPETEVTIGDPQYLAPDNKLFITSHTLIELHAVDNPGGSGVNDINYRINDGSWMTIEAADCSFEIIGEDGMYTVTYYSSDNCDNFEGIKSIILYLDNTPPEINMCVELKGTTSRVYLPDDTTEIELTDNEKLIAEVEDTNEKEVGTVIISIPFSGLASAKFRIDNGVWQELTIDNLDAALIGMDEVLTEIEAIDNVDNTIRKSYIISHYAIFSVPGAVISVTGDIMLNSGITIDSYDSETGMQNTGDGDVISKGKITVNGTPDINGDLYDYTDPGIEQVPVPEEAIVIDSIIVNSGETKIIEHGTYYIKNLIVNSNGRLIIRGGWVKIWFDWCTVDGEIEVDTVKHLWMLGTDTTQHMNINGTTVFKGILFVPKGYINVNKIVDGSVIGKAITVNSGAHILYDQDSLIHDRWSTIGDASAQN